jgi:hypothetical protein
MLTICAVIRSDCGLSHGEMNLERPLVCSESCNVASCVINTASTVEKAASEMINSRLDNQTATRPDLNHLIYSDSCTSDNNNRSFAQSANCTMHMVILGQD